MSETIDPGIRVSEMASTEPVIELAADTTVAFIGRTLCGPLNTPVRIDSMAAFTRRFGGVWRHSALGPAVAQFFANGGRELYVVRVANNARSAMLCLPADGGVLVMHAVVPGCSESLRAAVDYDGIDAGDEEHFNLIVQRLSPLDGYVVDQEIYRRLSCRPESSAWIGEALLGSALVRPRAPLPPGRPRATMGRGADSDGPYLALAQRGSDGSELTDYDLIGSAVRGTGLFALDRLDDIDLLYLPAPGRTRDAGPAALLAAERYCRKRGAMLIVDPPAQWRSVAEAVQGARRAGYTSPDMLSYFPRLRPRRGPEGTPRAAGAALAALLQRLDACRGPWASLGERAFALQRELVPALAADDEALQLLTRAGLNVWHSDPSGRTRLAGEVTLGHGSQGDRRFGSLALRRLCLAIGKAVDRATRWAVFDTDRDRVAEDVGGQVRACLERLADAGALGSRQVDVRCEPGPCGAERSLTILISFLPRGGREPLSLTLYQSASGCRVSDTAFAPVTVACA